MDLREKIEKELSRMEDEVKHCYEIANKNKSFGMEMEWRRWTARADAFRDCIEILRGVL